MTVSAGGHTISRRRRHNDPPEAPREQVMVSEVLVLRLTIRRADDDGLRGSGGARTKAVTLSLRTTPLLTYPPSMFKTGQNQYY